MCDLFSVMTVQELVSYVCWGSLPLTNSKLQTLGPLWADLIPPPAPGKDSELEGVLRKSVPLKQ